MYEPPDWSALPQDDFSLEIIKDGCVIGEVPLKDKAFFIMGRQHDAVDIPMDHPSISRRHAVLNFRNDGALMIADLKSAQGTMVNKKALTEGYQRLYVGDVIKIAGSSRLYIVKGPEDQQPGEYISQNLESLRRQSQDKAERFKQKAAQAAAQGVSWGMGDDSDEDDIPNDKEDPEDDEGGRKVPDYLRKDENYDRKYGDKFNASIADSDARNAKDQEILEKIRRKERKIQNMQEENRRIYLKESSQESGLTAGQLAAVSRNDTNITSLTDEIDKLVANIKGKNTERDSKTVEGGKKRKVDDRDEEVLDTSNATADTSTNWRLRKKLATHAGIASSVQTAAKTSAAMGYQEISDALAQGQTKQTALQQALEEANAGISQLREVISKCRQDGEDLDAVIKEDELKEKLAEAKALANEEALLRDRMAQLQTLLVVATPALKSLISHAKPAVKATPAAAAVAGEAGAATAPTATAAIALPVNKITLDAAHDTEESRLEAFRKFVEEERIKEEEEQAQQTAAKKMAAEQAKTAALDGLRAEAGSEKKAAPKPVKGPARPPVVTTAALPTGDRRVLEGGDAAWVPPKAQTGDGRTALNDKFGY